MRTSIIASLAAIAIAAPAHAAVVTVQYGVYTGPDVTAPPPDVSATLSRSGLPQVTAHADYVNVANDGSLLWWTSANNGWAGPQPTPSVITSPNLFVDAFPGGGFPRGFDTVTATATFTSPSAAVENLFISSDMDAYFFLNGSLVLAENASGKVYTASIGEALVSGNNVIQVFAFDADSLSPVLSFDPAIPVAGAPATPEAGTLAMCAAGMVALGWRYRRRRADRLALAV